MNSMFELATLDEIDKLRETDGGSGGRSSEDLELDDLVLSPVVLVRPPGQELPDMRPPPGLSWGEASPPMGKVSPVEKEPK